MAGLRKLSRAAGPALTPCSRCQAHGCPWDRIADKVICPDCQEALARGDAPPLIEKLEKDPCACCGRLGTVRFLTYPLQGTHPIEIDLCPEHFRGLLQRRLERLGFNALKAKLQHLGVAAHHIFLLHESFYDGHGRPLQPVGE